MDSICDFNYDLSTILKIRQLEIKIAEIEIWLRLKLGIKNKITKFHIFKKKDISKVLESESDTSKASEASVKQPATLSGTKNQNDENKLNNSTT